MLYPRPAVLKTLLLIALGGCHPVVDRPTAMAAESTVEPNAAIRRAVARSAELAALKAAAPGCAAIKPILEQVEAGRYAEAWYHQAWEAAEQSVNCQRAYDHAWDILWPVNGLYEILKSGASKLEWSRSYPLLEEPILRMIPDSSFEKWRRHLQTTCAQADPWEGSHRAKNHEDHCTLQWSEFSRAARFSKFAECKVSGTACPGPDSR